MRVLVATLLLTLALGGPALAGGWAVSTLDTLPPEIHAGQTYTIGWTIRQHGQTPIDVESMGGSTEIQATTPDGTKTLSFRGRRDSGPTGHYVASVLFPTDGTWTWQVTQGPFAPQPLGTLIVLAAAGTAATSASPATQAAPLAAAPAPARSGPNPWLIAALLLAASGAAVVFGSRIAAVMTRTARA